jgi:hypothetical protein
MKNTPSTHALSKREVDEDLSCLKLLYKNAYAGLDYFKKSENLDISKLSFNSASINTSMQLFENIIEHHQLFYDLHFQITLGNNTWRFFKPDLDNYPIMDSKKTVFKKIEENLYYLKPGDLKELNKIQTEAIEFIAKNDFPLIIDLRNNGGGRDTFPFQLSEVIYKKGHRIPLNFSKTKYGAIPFMGLAMSIYLTNGNIYDDSFRYVFNAAKEFQKDNFFKFYEYKADPVEYRYGKRDQAYQSNIILWTNRLCASACETFVEKLQPLHNVRTVGENTAGGIHLSNPATFQLPNSKIIISLPITYQDYENDAPEGEGYNADIKLDNLSTIDEVIKYLLD